MKTFFTIFFLTAAAAMVSCLPAAHASPNDRIKAFCIDFNWGAGGPNGFPAPGTFAQADPTVHYQYYKDLGVNVIQTFCVSCNGYAWYQGSAVAPVQPGLKHDFLKQLTELAHKDEVKVMGYFCVGANTYWGQKHPELSYGSPSGIHIPFTSDYLDYLAGCIQDALAKTGIDGFMIDWAFSPPLLMEEKNVQWLPCEQKMYAELFGRPFPGKDLVDAKETLEFQRRALERCWHRIQKAAKSTKPDCVIWLSCFDLSHPQVVGTAMLREVDWVMNETPTPEKLDATRQMVGPHAKLIQCVSGGSTEYDASKVLDNPKYKDVGLYGFAPWPDPKTTLPPDPPQDATQKNIRTNIEKLRRVYVSSASAAAPEAKLARPTSLQYAWHEQERIMFVCLDPCTWQGREYDNHSTPLSAINPTQLDTDQWCRAAKLWGAREILFVAKHTGGFCWWQTEATQYGIKNTAWKGGQGDVLAELSAACRKHGLNLGIYVYPGDETWGAPIGSGGRTKDPSKQEAYNQVFRQQLTEVLTRYGKITEVWFDGSCVIDVGDILKQHAADAVILQGPQTTLRWPGTESGRLPYPAWNSLTSQDLKTGVATAAQGNPDGDAWAPLEADTTLYDHNWFWAADNEKKRKSLDELMDIYYKSAGHGGVLLLNSTPNTNGLIPSGDLNLYSAFGQEIERRFSRPLAEVKDQQGASIELILSRPTLINHAVIMEDYREGERIREYVVEGLSDGQWKELSRGTSVGRKKIDRFLSVQVSQVRLRVTRFAAKPLLRSLAVFQVESVSAGSLKEFNLHPNPPDWQPCGAWTVESFREGKATLTLDLSPFIPKPGQYEVKFEQTRGLHPLRILNATLLYEGEEATPGLLTRLKDAAHSFNVNRPAQVTKETKSVLKVEITAAGGTDCHGTVWIRPQVSDAKPGAAVLQPDSFRHYVDAFNRNDRETVVNHIPNAAAWGWMTKNVPLFECPDENIEETYYFRWWTYRKHLKQTPDGFVVTEFLPQVSWSKKHNTINCPVGHHLYEGRWIHDPKFLDDATRFYLGKGGDPGGVSKVYSNWLTDGIYARCLVNGDKSFITGLLDELVKNHEAWNRDGAPGDAMQKRRRLDNGLYWQIDSWEGQEFSIGGTGLRPPINSYMFGDAVAIARIAELAGRKELGDQYRAEAEQLRKRVQDQLWDAADKFFKVMRHEQAPTNQYGNTAAEACEPGKRVKAREIFGYVPWYFNLPEDGRGYEEAWRQLTDPQGFLAPYGPTVAERRHPNFKINDAGCQWCGASWPFTTAQTLTALANLLNNYHQEVLGKKDYFDTLKTYARSHRRKLNDGSVVSWIDESLNPDTGVWIPTGDDPPRGRDYNHSTYCDLVISGLVGLRPRADDVLEVNPLVPEGTWDWFCLDRVLYHGRILTVVYDRTGKRYGKGKGLQVLVDGQRVASSDSLQRVTAKFL